MESFATQEPDNCSSNHRRDRRVPTPALDRAETAAGVAANYGFAVQRKLHCACDGGCPRCQQDSPSHISPEILAALHDIVRSSGQPLDSATRALMEPRFGKDFSDVRLHTDPQAARSARAIDALAYAAGSHIVFAEGQLAPATPAGQRLLAHELTHVVQQSGNVAAMNTRSVGRNDSPLECEAEQVSAAVTAGRSVKLSGLGTAGAGQVQRQGYGDVRLAEHRDEIRARLALDYKKAENGNKANAKNGPAWEKKLATAAGGAHKAWHDLWVAGQYNAFADQVASFQIDIGLPEKSVDGILGAQTWARLAGLGEAMAGIEEVTWPKSETTCTVASEERIKRGYKLATGRTFELPEDKNASDFNVILQSINSRLLDVPEEYRGTGAAGALVYAGLGRFVSESDIWAGKLEPGAALQVWGNRKDFNLMRAGRIKEDGKWRRINDSDGSFSGTSFVFIRYDTDTNERMLVRHFGGSEWKSKSWYEVWVAANPVTPEAQLPTP
jgi:Domain of unknown function (DUF4157)